MIKPLLVAACCIFVATFLLIINSGSQIQAQDTRSLVDGNLGFEVIATDLRLPTSLAFLDQDDFLVLEQSKGTVLRVKDNKTFPTPVLDVNVAQLIERGLLGIEVMRREFGSPFVFLYYTEAESKDGGPVLGDRLYRFNFVDDLNGGKLVNKTLLLDIPPVPTLVVPGRGSELQVGPSLMHHGGSLLLGPDRNLYLTVGDLSLETKAQNFMNGADPVGDGGILRLTPEGNAVGNGILGSTHPLDKYYAYGIRNSFGIDFDPVTGYLWDTENGNIIADEINLVKPGFNSGWRSLMGFIQNQWQAIPDQEKLLAAASTLITNAIRHEMANNMTAFDLNLKEAQRKLVEVYPLLYDFGGSGVYSDPEFVWSNPVGPTAIQFYDSTVLGLEHLNHMFVGEYNSGKILNFELNENRTGLSLHDELLDRIANTRNETNSLLFGEGFGGITDLEIGPDGYLYVVEHGAGTVGRIVPKSASGVNSTGIHSSSVH